MVYLLAVIRGAASEDLSYVIPLDKLKERLAPTPELEHEMLLELYRERLLFIHPGSPKEAFVLTESPWQFYSRDVFWALPIGKGGETLEPLEGLERTVRENDFPDQWEEDALELWKKIALHECLEYLTLTMEQHNLPAKPGPKTHSTLSSLLYEFSVAQIYSFIWRAAKDAAAFYMREGTTKSHAANTVVGAIQRQADSAKARGWIPREFRRNFDAPQSMLSRVLFGAFLGAGDSGFSTPLNASDRLLRFNPSPIDADDLESDGLVN